MAAAAHELGISETTVRQHLSGLYRRTGCLNAGQAAYWLGTTDLGSDATPRRVATAEGQPMVRSIGPDAIKPWGSSRTGRRWVAGGVESLVRVSTHADPVATLVTHLGMVVVAARHSDIKGA